MRLSRWDCKASGTNTIQDLFMHECDVISFDKHIDLMDELRKSCQTTKAGRSHRISVAVVVLGHKLFDLRCSNDWNLWYWAILEAYHAQILEGARKCAFSDTPRTPSFHNGVGFDLFVIKTIGVTRTVWIKRNGRTVGQTDGRTRHTGDKIPMCSGI